MDPVHKDVGRSFGRVFHRFEEGFDVFAVDVVAASFSLRLQDETLRVGEGHRKSLVAGGSLIKEISAVVITLNICIYIIALFSKKNLLSLIEFNIGQFHLKME